MIEVFPSFEGFRLSGSTPFATDAWCRAALRKDSTARIVVWRDERDPDARVVFPFSVTDGVLEFIGQDLADVNDAVVEKPSDHLHWAWKEACDAIGGMEDVKRIRFEKCPAASPFIAFCAVRFRGALAFRSVGHSSVGTGLSHLKQRDRSRVKALEARDGILSVATPDGSRLEDVALELEGLASFMRERRWRKAGFWGDREKRVLGTMWDAGIAEVAFLRDRGGIAKAAAIRFTKGGTVWCWMAFYRDPKSLTELYSKHLEYLRNRDPGLTVDFGSGTYGWKIGTFRPEIHPCVTFRWSRTRLGRFMDWMRMLVRNWRV